MRALLPHYVEDVDVHDHYARGWLDHGGVRVDMLASLDGAASAAGLSAGLQTPADTRVFAALRDLADVVVAGATTVRAEGYAPIRLAPGRRALRRRYGLAESLPTAVLSARLDLDLSAALFSTASPDAPTIVLTCAAAPAEAREALSRAVDLLICGDRSIDFDAARAALAERGLTRVLCEGGPTTFAGLAAADQVDELCLSITPMLAGPGAPRIVAGAPWTGELRRMRLIGLLEEDGAIFQRLSAEGLDH